jgi:hypothetical protein
MAKEPDITDMFAKTEAAKKIISPPQKDNNDLDEGRVQPVGVGLTRGEEEALKVMAAEHGVRVHALLKLAIRKFIVEVRKGAVNIEDYLETSPEPKKKLKKIK